LKTRPNCRRQRFGSC